MILLVKLTYYNFSQYVIQLTPVFRNGNVDQSIKFSYSLTKAIELLIAKMTQIESALNKTPVLTPTAERQAAKEHDNVSVHAPLHVFAKDEEHEEALSPSTEKYRYLYNKEGITGKNECNAIVWTYNHSDVK